MPNKVHIYNIAAQSSHHKAVYNLFQGTMLRTSLELRQKIKGFRNPETLDFPCVEVT